MTIALGIFLVVLGVSLGIMVALFVGFVVDRANPKTVAEDDVVRIAERVVAQMYLDEQLQQKNDSTMKG